MPKMVREDYFGLISFEEMEEYSKTRRWHMNKKKTVGFMDSGGGLSGRVLDVGPRSPITSVLEDHYRISVVNTGKVDLNWGMCLGDSVLPFDYALCFHVIEHLVNPLVCLVNIQESLKKSGTLYLATPRCRLSDHLGPWPDRHFQEFNWRQLKILLDLAGFEVVRVEQIRVVYPYVGIRPLCRMFSRVNFLIEAMRKDRG